jgi:hypothetical protein
MMAKADAYDESFEKLIDNGKFSSVGMVLRSPSSYSNAVTMSPSAFAGIWFSVLILLTRCSQRV